MTIKLMNTADISLKNGIKATVYGHSGTGKTRLLASAPNPVILSAEQGLLSLRKYTLPYIEINSLADLKEAFNWVQTSAQAKQFQTICLDSISEIAEVILVEEQKKNRNGQKAYGDAQDTIIEYYRNFRNLAGKHVVFTAKNAMLVDGANGAFANGPGLPGKKLPQAAPYFFDSVFQLLTYPPNEHGYIARGLRTQPDLQNQAKDRSGNLDPIENADPTTGGGLTAIFEKMLR